MNKDIVERLRAATPYGLEDAYVLRDAALEIEHLRALVARVENAAETEGGT
jgi:hypothetical protein